MPTKHHLLCLTLLLALAGCADTPAPSTDETGINDPLETMNRRSFDNNHFLDRLLLRPLAELYRVTVPPPVRDRITGILANMNEPTIFANDVMQGEFGKAGTTFERLAINSTLGIGGMWDVATDWGMQKQTGDFGQTLASWGVGEGPYLMLPLVGPSDMRDAFGRGVDTAMSPWQWITLGAGNLTTFTEFEVSDFTADAIVRREKNIEVIDQLRANSVDPYSTARSAWLQHRRKQLGQTQATSMPKMDEE